MSDEIKVEEEPCERCEMQKLMVSASVAHVACGTIQEEGDRGKCMQWAADLDLSKMSAEDVMEGAYDRAGIAGLAAFPEMHDALIRKLIIKKVGQKLESGIPVTEEEIRLYKKYTKKEVAQGI